MKKLIYSLALLFTILMFGASSFFSQTPPHNCGQHIVLRKLLKNSEFKSYYDKEQRSVVFNNLTALL